MTWKKIQIQITSDWRSIRQLQLESWHYMQTQQATYSKWFANLSEFFPEFSAFINSIDCVIVMLLKRQSTSIYIFSYFFFLFTYDCMIKWPIPYNYLFITNLYAYISLVATMLSMEWIWRLALVPYFSRIRCSSLENNELEFYAIDGGRSIRSTSIVCLTFHVHW